MAGRPNPFDFTGKVILVTGSGKGLGRGIAARFAGAGASLAVHCRFSREGADRLAAEIRLMGQKAHVFQAGLEHEQEVDGLVAEVEKELGIPDVLVNNAGEYPLSDLLEMSVADWDRVVGSNLRSTFMATRAVARQMASRGKGGVIINLASIEAAFPAPGHSHYDAAKAGVLMLTRSSAQELGKYDIRVNAISPGLIWREGIDQAWPDGVQAWMKTAPLKRLGYPQDIADACLFLASSAASWITGANLVVDGGISCRPAF